VIEDWYQRLQEDGLLDVLSPYSPVMVGTYPLNIAGPQDPVEIVCRAVELPAFARTLERSYGDREGFVLHPGSLDNEPAVFAEFSLDGMPVEVSAQAQHVNQRLGRATLGIDRVLDESGELARDRLRSRVANGQDWLDAAMEQFNLDRMAIESLSTANPGLVRQVMGIKGAPLPWAAYLLPILIGVTADVLIVAAGAARGSQEYTGIMLLLQASVLGFLFGARLGLVAALTPLVGIGLWLIAPILVGNSSACGSDCGETIGGYFYVLVLVAAAAGVVGALRDRYRPVDTSPGRAR
jgi:Domain of unknown function (DUF4269)